MAVYSEEEFLTLLDISEMDKRLTQLRFRKENLSEAHVLQEITVRARDLQIQGVELQAELVELQDHVTKAEIDVEQVASRMKKDQDLLDSGSITDSKQLLELQHELGNLQKRLTELEDVELEALSNVEEAKSKIQTIENETKIVEEELLQAKMALEKAIAEVDLEIQTLEDESNRALSTLNSSLQDLYLKIRRDKGIGAAKLNGSKCESCHLELRGSEFSEIKNFPLNELVRCPECKTILIRVERV